MHTKLTADQILTKLTNRTSLPFTRESESEVARLCPTLCNPMDYSLPGSSVHEIFQVRILGWVAIPFTRGSSRPGG